MDINSIIDDFEKTKQQFIVKKSERDGLLTQKKRIESKLQRKRDEVTDLEMAKYLLSQSSIYGKTKVKKALENLVTSGLQYVFNKEIYFEIDINTDGARTEAQFFVVSYIDGHKVRMDPLEERGGGVVDFISIMLRFAMVLTHHANIKGALELDEPTKMVSNGDYIEKIKEFIRDIMCNKFGRQIIMTTHNTPLSEIGDIIYYVDLINDVSEVIEI